MPLSNYQMVKTLGRGGFGIVYLVRSRLDNHEYVLKEVDLGADHKAKKEALKEVKFLSKMKHPFIVKYKEFFEENASNSFAYQLHPTPGSQRKYLYIVMEFADSGDLSGFLKNQAKTNNHLAESLILSWFCQICLALKHIHSSKVLHRDLKSENLFLKRSGPWAAFTGAPQILLGDFGIARELAHSMNKANTQIGTPYYLSPEICSEKPYDKKTDIWSLGVILFEMINLTLPFKGNSLRQLISNIIGSAPCFSDRARSIYSKPLIDLCFCLLHKNPNSRPTIDQILKIPILQDQVKKFLSDNRIQEEFSKTILTQGYIAHELNQQAEKKNKEMDSQKQRDKERDAELQAQALQRLKDRDRLEKEKSDRDKERKERERLEKEKEAREKAERLFREREKMKKLAIEQAEKARQRALQEQKESREKLAKQAEVLKKERERREKEREKLIKEKDRIAKEAKDIEVFIPVPKLRKNSSSAGPSPSPPLPSNALSPSPPLGRNIPSASASPPMMAKPGVRVAKRPPWVGVGLDADTNQDRRPSGLDYDASPQFHDRRKSRESPAFEIPDSNPQLQNRRKSRSSGSYEHLSEYDPERIRLEELEHAEYANKKRKELETMISAQQPQPPLYPPPQVFSPPINSRPSVFQSQAMNILGTPPPSSSPPPSGDLRMARANSSPVYQPSPSTYGREPSEKEIYEAQLAAARKAYFEERKQMELRMKNLERGSQDPPRHAPHPVPESAPFKSSQNYSPPQPQQTSDPFFKPKESYEDQLKRARQEAYAERVRLQQLKNQYLRDHDSSPNPPAQPLTDIYESSQELQSSSNALNPLFSSTQDDESATALSPKESFEQAIASIDELVDNTEQCEEVVHMMNALREIINEDDTQHPSSSKFQYPEDSDEVDDISDEDAIPTIAEAEEESALQEFDAFQWKDIKEGIVMAADSPANSNLYETSEFIDAFESDTTLDVQIQSLNEFLTEKIGSSLLSSLCSRVFCSIPHYPSVNYDSNVRVLLDSNFSEVCRSNPKWSEHAKYLSLIHQFIMLNIHQSSV